MVGIIAIAMVELLGSVAQLACLSSCNLVLPMMCCAYVREYSVRTDGQKDRALRLE